MPLNQSPALPLYDRPTNLTNPINPHTMTSQFATHYSFHMDEQEPVLVHAVADATHRIAISTDLADREQNALMLLGRKAVTVGPVGPYRIHAILETDGTFTYGDLRALTSWHLVWHLKQVLRQARSHYMIANLQACLERDPMFALSLITLKKKGTLATLVESNGGL